MDVSVLMLTVFDNVMQRVMTFSCFDIAYNNRL